MRVAAGILLGLLLVALVGPRFAPHDPTRSDDSVALRLLPPLSRVPALVTEEGTVLPIGGWEPAAPQVRVHDWRVEGDAVVYRRGPRYETIPLETLRRDANGGPLVVEQHYLAGTDRFGRDLTSRLLIGARVSLLIGLGSVLVACVLGALFGMSAGLLGRAVDLVISRASDATLAIPRIILVMFVAAYWELTSLELAVLMGATGWPPVARLVRSEVRALARSDLALSARSIGNSLWRVAWRHLAPHTATVLFLAAALRLGPFILLEASLSFLGFGVHAPSPSWGNILTEGRAVLHDAWWVATFPGLLLGASVLLANAAADRVRRRLGEAG